MKRFVVGTVLVVGLLLGRVPDVGATVMFGGASDGLSATAEFTISGNTLTILLTNTDTAPTGAAWTSSEELSGLFFNLGTSAFAPNTATVGGPGVGATGVGSDWGYSFGPVTNPAGGLSALGVNQGISSAEYLTNLQSGNPRNFRGSDLHTAEAGLDGGPLINGPTRFVLSVPSGLNEESIANVYFTYGTSLNDPRFEGRVGGGGRVTVVPEPSALAFLSIGLAAAAYGLRRRRHSRS